MKIKMKDEIGSRCIVRDDGQMIYDAIHPVLKRGETATLDFESVAQFASPFFNYAIGQLLKDISIDDVRKRLIIENLLPDGERVVERVIDNAGRYHQDADYRNIVDSILQRQSEMA